jgi:hypothetical protein
MTDAELEAEGERLLARFKARRRKGGAEVS